jgi:hypothetical protein
MRKMIIMALAGFIWRKLQARIAGRALGRKTMRRY